MKRKESEVDLKNFKTNMREEYYEKFNNAEESWICEQPFLIKSHYVYLFIAKKLKQNKLKSVPV